MSPRIYIEPSGHEIQSLGKESILESGLRDGLALDYGCSNGNCGFCKARLVSGELETTHHSDFWLNEQERAQGWFLMCANRPVSDIVIEAPEAYGATDILHQEITARVKKIEHITDQVIVLYLRTPRAQRLRFLAGQSVILGGGGVPQSPLPIASCPCDDRNIHFHIPYIPYDEFSEYVFSGGLNFPNRLTIRGPEGEFILDPDKRRPLIFIAWHTGFGPVKSMIEHAVSLEWEEEIYLYRISPVPGQHYMDNLCRAWTDAIDNIQYRPISTRYTLMSPPEDADSVLAGIADRHDRLGAFDIFVSGPNNLVSSSRSMAARMGLRQEQVATSLVDFGI